METYPCQRPWASAWMELSPFAALARLRPRSENHPPESGDGANVRVVFTPEAFNQTAGGISRIFAELATGLTERSERAEVAAGLYVNQYIRGLRSVKGIYVPRFPRLARALVNTAHCHLAIARAPGAIVHQTYYSRHRYSRKHALVVTVFDMIHELFPGLLAKSGTVAKTIADKAFCCARADQICAISHQTKRDLIRILGVDEKKVSVTWLGNALHDRSLI